MEVRAAAVATVAAVHDVVNAHPRALDVRVADHFAIDRAGEISLEIDSATHRGEWQALNLENDQEATRQLELDDPASWAWVVGEIRMVVG